MKKLQQRFMAFLMAFVMVIGMVPQAALAAGDGPQGDAVTYYVADSSGEDNDKGVVGSNVNGDGSSTKPFLSIAHALEVAKQNGETDIIIYLLSNIRITKTLSFSDSTVKNIKLDGNNYSITYAGDEDLGTRTAAVVVSNGNSVHFEDLGLTREEGNTYKGGLLYVEDASVTLHHVNMTNGLLAVSDVADGGSAIHVAKGGKVDLENSTRITNNKTVGSNTSGAIFVAEGGTLNVSYAIIEDNAEANYGDGIYAQHGSNVNFYSTGSAITVLDEIYVEVGANVTVGATEGESEHIRLDYVWLESDVTAEADIATMDISGDTSEAKIGIEVLDNYHYAYRLISAEANGYSIETTAGNMDESGWTDLDGLWDIRYMNYKGVPGLYFYYHTFDATFHDVDTLTGIDGTDINGEAVDYYNPETVINSTVENGILTIPEIVPVGNGDYVITFTVDEANKDYRIPTPDVIQIVYGGEVLLNDGSDYKYEPDYENGTAKITVFSDTMKKLNELTTPDKVLDFNISGEKYSLLTLSMHGPLYTMTTDITGQSVRKALSVVETITNDGADISYEITRDGWGVPNVSVVLYREGSNYTVTSGLTDAEGKVSFEGLDPSYSYYYIIYYNDSFHVIARDVIDVQLSTLEGQKMSDRCDFNTNAVDVSYSVTDSENYGMATSTLTGTKEPTTVIYYVDLAQDTIMFDANQQDATTADTATFVYTGVSYRQDEFSKTMETNAHTYGNLPSITMEGYTFLGWFDTEDWEATDTRITSGTAYDTVSSPKTLYAHWAPHDVDYGIQHWVEWVEYGVNPGYIRGTTPTKTVDGVTYYLWQYVPYKDELADSTMKDVMHLALTEMNVPQYSWWTLDGFTISSEQNCKVLADGSSIFSLYYDRNLYTINYNPVGDNGAGQMTSALDEQTVKYGANVGPMLVAVRSGYAFGGWYYAVDEQNEVVVTATSWYTWTKDIEVTPKWIQSNTTYTIKLMVEDKSYDAEGLAYADGTYTQYKTVTKNNEGLPLPGISDREMTVEVASLDALKFDGFTYEGYNMTGDRENPVFTADDADFTFVPNEFGTTIVYLYYSRNEVEVTFRSDDDPQSPAHDTVTIVYGDEFGPALPETNPTKPGYDFTGWADAHGNPVTETTDTNEYTAAGDGVMDVFPVWNARVYYLTYVPGEGVTFDTSAMGVGYTINSDVSGGYTVSQPITYDALIGLMPYVEWAGYEFLGWKLNDGPAAGTYVVDTTKASIDNVIVENAENSYEDTRVLYADFEAYEYTLVLDPGKGTVNPTSLTVTYGQPIPTLPTPEYTGYTFVGWMLDTGDAAGTRIESGDIWNYITTNGSAVHAHAMYHANKYSYDLNLNDVDYGNGSTKATLFDTSISGVEIEFDSPLADVLDGVVAHRNGYTFLGWSTTTDKDDLITKDDVNTLSQDTTVYAIWQPKVYELHINLNGGQLPMTNSYSWNDYADRYYEDYEQMYGVPAMNAVQTVEGKWIVPIIFDTVYGDLDQLSRENYKFEGYLVGAPGWFDAQGNYVLDGQIVNALDMGYNNSVDAYITLDAVWTPYFDFVLDKEGASFTDGDVNDKHILRTDLIAAGELPVAQCDGYTFLGWYDDIKQDYVDFTFVTGLSEYRSFRAIFTPNITFDANGGKVIVGGQKYDTYTIGLRHLVDNYGDFLHAEHDTKTLMGWIADDTSDMTAFENIINRATPMTLTASWDITITFDLSDGAYWGDGSYEDRTVTAYEVGQWSELPTAYLDGYTFLYWYDDAGNQVTPAGLYAANESMTVYSSFIADGGAGSGINVTVTNYAPTHATYVEPAQWVVGDNTFVVKCESACGVALIRNGVMTELQCTANGEGYDYIINAQDGDEVVIVLKGDADLDDMVTVTDMTRISQYLVDLYQFSDLNKLAADADNDDLITVTDMTRISQSLVDLYTMPWNELV